MRLIADPMEGVSQPLDDPGVRPSGVLVQKLVNGWVAGMGDNSDVHPGAQAAPESPTGIKDLPCQVSAHQQKIQRGMYLSGNGRHIRSRALGPFPQTALEKHDPDPMGFVPPKARHQLPSSLFSDRTTLGFVYECERILIAVRPVPAYPRRASEVPCNSGMYIAHNAQ